MDLLEIMRETEPTESLDDDDTEQTLFTIDMEVMIKDFVSQKIGTSKTVFQVNVNTVVEFCSCVWTMIVPFIQKEVIFNDERQRYEWASEELNATNLSKFVVFQDKVSKRTYEVLHLSNKLLLAWKKKKGLICLVHVYGNVLKKKQHYEQAFKQVIQPDCTDRAGAVTNAEVFKCMDELKVSHPDLIATEASWLRWANWIKKQPGHEREQLMRSDPPADKPNLFELFKLTRRDTERFQEIRTGISIGKRVNESIVSVLPNIESEVDDLIEIFKVGLTRAERIKAHVEGIKSQLANNNSLMDGFNEALGPNEDQFSQNLLQDMENIDDIDHQHLFVEDV